MSIACLAKVSQRLLHNVEQKIFFSPFNQDLACLCVCLLQLHNVLFRLQLDGKLEGLLHMGTPISL